MNRAGRWVILLAAVVTGIALALVLGWDALLAALHVPAAAKQGLQIIPIAVTGALVGALAAGAGTAFWFHAQRSGDGPRPFIPPNVFDDGRLGALLLVAMIGVVVLGVFAAVDQGVGAAAAAAGVLFAALTLAAAGPAVSRLQKGEALEFESYWGGLGGAQGGWRLSSTAAFCASALLFAAASCACFVGAAVLARTPPPLSTTTQPAPSAHPAPHAKT